MVPNSVKYFFKEILYDLRRNDVAKDKHGCFITNSDGEVLFKPFIITNNRDGFADLFNKICSVTKDLSKVKVVLEATGHYSYNLLGFLVDRGLAAFVINPLHTNLYRKSLSLRQTKTDKVDARTIASMLMSDVNLKSYSGASKVSSAHLTRLTLLIVSLSFYSINEMYPKSIYKNLRLLP